MRTIPELQNMIVIEVQIKSMINSNIMTKLIFSITNTKDGVSYVEILVTDWIEKNVC